MTLIIIQTMMIKELFEYSKGGRLKVYVLIGSCIAGEVIENATYNKLWS